jgi:hypothetical protein
MRRLAFNFFEIRAPFLCWKRARGQLEIQTGWGWGGVAGGEFIINSLIPRHDGVKQTHTHTHSVAYIHIIRSDLKILLYTALLSKLLLHNTMPSRV